MFLADTYTCPILGPLVPLFWLSGDVSSGFQSQSGFCLIRFFAEVNVMYIPWDPPLVLHLPTSWRPAFQSVAYPHAHLVILYCYCYKLLSIIKIIKVQENLLTVYIFLYSVGMFWVLSQYVEMYFVLAVGAGDGRAAAARYVLETRVETEAHQEALLTQTGRHCATQGQYVCVFREGGI